MQQGIVGLEYIDDLVIGGEHMLTGKQGVSSLKQPFPSTGLSTFRWYF